jgi:ABC-type Fe3+/spermidine/putrescine transport system ATPase subunit
MLLSGADAGAAGARLTLAIRPERVRLATPGARGRAAGVGGTWDGVIEEVVYVGAMRKYQVRVAGQALVARQQAGSDVASFAEGERVEVGWSLADLKVVRKH